MAPIIASLKNLIRRGKKKQNKSTTSSSSSSACTQPIPPSMQSQDSGTALTSASSSPPARHAKAQSCSVHSPSRSHSSPSTTQTFSMVRSTPSSRSASPSTAAVAVPSIQHFSPTPVAVQASTHRDFDTHQHNHPQHHQHQPQQQRQHQEHALTDNQTGKNENKKNDGTKTFGVNNNTEAASRMVAQANQQKSILPVFPGLERFTLLEKMGDGAFSNVFKAHDTRADRIVAIKVVRKVEMNAHQNVKRLHRDMQKKPRVTERANILKEVQIMRQLKHPGIIELYEFFESDEYYYLVLEIAAGGELFHRIVQLTYFSEDLARHVIVQVAKAIRYLHEEKGVIHRDIKPENILFEPIPIIPSPPGFSSDEEDKEDEGVFIPGIGGGGIGRVKIADFGLSKIVWDEQTMTPCGTVGYTAPEIVKDERYSKSVDMWALGCVLYTLLVGFPPFYDESIQALTEKVARGQYTFLSPWWDEISAEVKDLISHLLCVNPHERYTIDQFLAHPWIRAGEQLTLGQTPDILDTPEISVATPLPMSIENKVLANVAAMTPDYGAPRTPRTPYKRRAENPLSPGIGLKEVFDVSNAVHRMGEESRRRQTPQVGQQPLDSRQRQAFMAQLNEEDDIEEEEEHDDYSGRSGSGMSEDEAIAEGISRVQVDGQALHQQQKEYQLAQERIAAENHYKYLRQQQQAGVPVPNQAATISKQPQHVAPLSKAVPTTATSGNRRRRGFELKMDQATLLKRRARQRDIEPCLAQTVERQDQLIGQPSPALAV